MANQGAKKRLAENKRHVKKLALIVIGANVIYILVRMVLFSTSTSWKHFIGMSFTSAVYYVTYEWLKDLANGSVDDDGELVDGGADMNAGGTTGYVHDILYITSFVQVASVISDKFWYTYLVIPMFAFYKLWQLVLYPYFFLSQQEEPENEESRKKREKAERKASRPKFGKVRR
ncbi:unnamed protein product [Calypogeia fissa]